MTIESSSPPPAFRFPPRELGEWRALDHADRVRWLDLARDRFFDRSRGFVPSKQRNRRVAIDGRTFDDLRGFFCAIGEAVNGPGGYFGRSMMTFEDCLFSGFGLDPPFTIVWRHADESRRTLDAARLVAFLDEPFPKPSFEFCDADELERSFAEGLTWRAETRAEALAGRRSLFDEIEDTILSVRERGGGDVTLVLE